MGCTFIISVILICANERFVSSETVVPIKSTRFKFSAIRDNEGVVSSFSSEGMNEWIRLESGCFALKSFRCYSGRFACMILVVSPTLNDLCCFANTDLTKG